MPLRESSGFSDLGLEPKQIEYEVVRDMVIGITRKDDPRLDVLGLSLTGKESVISSICGLSAVM